ncbi:MAG: PilZ domain-containing protein [Planctomycetota bacterium]|nr:PilZ domain-containing protein [Planctomycetota bacterium]
MAIPLNDQPKPNPSETPRPRTGAGGRDGRRQYRVQKQAGTQLEATILCADGRKAVGECADLSVGGVGILVPLAKNIEIVEGAKLRVRVQHVGRAKGIEAAAVVVSVSHVGGSVRYGMRFESIAEVVQQVDSFYARWFNRRRTARVMPDFATKVMGVLKWSDGEMQARVHDISMGGVGILATMDQVAGLKEKCRVELALTLPGAPLPIACRARVVGIKTFTKNVLIGLEFEANGGIERYAAALQRYIDERQKSIAKFNEAMAQQPKRAG